mgnify:CR=1 FL=1|jgi:hypothetical protein
MDIRQPIIHDRHVVKQYFENMKSQNIHKNAFTMPKDLTLVTCRNEGTMEDRIIDHLKGYEEKSILECSLEYLGIEGLVILTDDRLPWRNTFKFEMLNNYLNSGDCKTKYFMFCDAIDVIFKDDPQKVVDIFESSDCDALFMSTTSTDGYNCMPDVKKSADNINGGNGRYLNSGTYIGKTEFIKEIVDECMKYAIPHGVTMGEYHQYLASNPIDYPKGSQDQDMFRFVEPMFHPRLKVDYGNLMAYRS